MIESIKDNLTRKIANEQKIIDRCAEEVTVDWLAVQAEVRHKAFVEVLDYVDRLDSTMEALDV